LVGRGVPLAARRYIGNAVQVFFRGGTSSQRVPWTFPSDTASRRAEGMPVLVKKFEPALRATSSQADRIDQGKCLRKQRLAAMPVSDFNANW